MIFARPIEECWAEAGVAPNEMHKQRGICFYCNDKQRAVTCVRDGITPSVHVCASCFREHYEVGE